MKQTKFKLNFRRLAKLLSIAVIIVIAMSSCSKEPSFKLTYFEVGIFDKPSDWRDSGFIVATSNAQLIRQAESELSLPVSERKILNGALVAGSGGYNKNGSFTFNWHLNETDWQLVDNSIEIYDGRPYSDVHQHPAYWLDTMKRYAPWNSYIKKKLD